MIFGTTLLVSTSQHSPHAESAAAYRGVPRLLDWGSLLSSGLLRILRNKEPWTVVHLYEKEILSLGTAAGNLDQLWAEERRYKQCQRLQFELLFIILQYSASNTPVPRC